MDVYSSILDFPRKTLPKKLWIYDSPEDLPKLNPTLRALILDTAKDYLYRYHLELDEARLYGGAASYQWSPGSDIDVSLYANGWPQDVTPEEIEKTQSQFKDIKIPYEGYEIHYYLKEPGEKVLEVADAVYDIIDDEWVLPPLVLPKGFDPDEFFAPLIKEAEKKAGKFDLKIGELRRSWSTLKKASEAKGHARDAQEVEDRIAEEKANIKRLTKELAKAFIKVREARYAMHDELREKMQKDIEIGRFERFQEPEIVWKYLDRAGYNDFLWKLYKIDGSGELDRILAKY